MPKMKKNYVKISLCLAVLSIIPDIICQTPEPMTTTPQPPPLTVAPLDLEALMNVDLEYGRYSTQEFYYVNWQHHYEDDEWFYKQDTNHTALVQRRCSAQFVKCISNLEVPAPVCVYNGGHTDHLATGFRSYDSYCHAYFENCFRYHNRFRIVAYGFCWFDWKGEHNSKFDNEKIIH